MLKLGWSHSDPWRECVLRLATKTSQPARLARRRASAHGAPPTLQHVLMAAGHRARVGGGRRRAPAGQLRARPDRGRPGELPAPADGFLINDPIIAGGARTRQPIGTVDALRRYAHLISRCSRPQRRGIGRRIVCGCSIPRAWPASSVIELRMSNMPAFAFYRSLGFAETIHARLTCAGASARG